MTISFSKLQGAGNDFIVLDARSMEHDWQRLSQDMSHRHFGIGADGLILVLPSEVADLKMRMFNPDGSEAEICGNGLRCFAKYVIDRGIVPNTSLNVETLAGIKAVQVFISQGKVTSAKIAMGTPRFKAAEIPVVVDRQKKGTVDGNIAPILDSPLNIAGNKLSLAFVSMGNPHAVHFTAKPVADFPLHEVGPKVEHHPMFPQRTNFEIARGLSRGNIEARVWERGAGETLACGSGACAIAVAAKLKRYTDNSVDIMLSGGTLTIDWDGVGEVYLTGPVEEVFIGEWLK